MGWKGNIVEVPVWALGKLARTSQDRPEDPASIFVLRNNDIGDLLVITPLFEALRLRFPSARIVAGIGQWNRDVLANNPHLSGTLEINAPWNNKYVARQRTRDVWRYIQHSAEVTTLKEQRFEVGIDILGSHVGSLLMMKAEIPYRLGVQGYRGGHSAVQQSIRFSDQKHVGRAALEFAELLGATELPECRPQLFLTAAEQCAGKKYWKKYWEGSRRPAANTVCKIVVGPGSGLPEKCWPREHFRALLQRISGLGEVRIIVVGGKQDAGDFQELVSGIPQAQSLAGALTLRETFAVVHAADLVVTNPSMLMHVAAAFSLPTVVLLGPAFDSASHHDRLWGYPDTCRSLGREKGKPVTSPTEAFSAVQEIIPRKSASQAAVRR